MVDKVRTVRLDPTLKDEVVQITKEQSPPWSKNKIGSIEKAGTWLGEAQKVKDELEEKYPQMERVRLTEAKWKRLLMGHYIDKYSFICFCKTIGINPSDYVNFYDIDSVQQYIWLPNEYLYKIKIINTPQDIEPKKEDFDKLYNLKKYTLDHAALLEICFCLSKYHSSGVRTRKNLKYPETISTEELINSNLYLVGGPKSNHLTQLILQDFDQAKQELIDKNFNWNFSEHSTKLIRENCNQIRKQLNWTFDTQKSGEQEVLDPIFKSKEAEIAKEKIIEDLGWNKDMNKEQTEKYKEKAVNKFRQKDYYMILMIPNPFNNLYKTIILAGLHSYGTLGSVWSISPDSPVSPYLLDDKQLELSENFLSKLGQDYIINKDKGFQIIGTVYEEKNKNGNTKIKNEWFPQEMSGLSLKLHDKKHILAK